MTQFGKKSFTWLMIGSVITGGAGVVSVIAQQKIQHVDTILAQVLQSEADLNTLKEEFEYWQANTPHGKAASNGMLRIEPVGVDVDFPPSSFNQLGTILGKMYTDEGILNLRKFSLDVGGGGIMHVSLSGQKTFLQE